MYSPIFDFHLVDCGEFLYIAYPSANRVNTTQAQTECAAQGNFELAVIDTQAKYDRMIDYFNSTQ